MTGSEQKNENMQFRDSIVRLEIPSDVVDNVVGVDHAFPRIPANRKDAKFIDEENGI